MSAGDHITARMFGQYITLQRCEWEQLRDETLPESDLHSRAAEVAARSKDELVDAPCEQCKGSGWWRGLRCRYCDGTGRA